VYSLVNSAKNMELLTVIDSLKIFLRKSLVQMYFPVNNMSYSQEVIGIRLHNLKMII